MLGLLRLANHSTSGGTSASRWNSAAVRSRLPPEIRIGAGRSLQRSSRPFQSAAVSRFDQIEAVGVVNRDVPVEGKFKQSFCHTNAVARAVARFEQGHELVKSREGGAPGGWPVNRIITS